MRRFYKFLSTVTNKNLFFVTQVRVREFYIAMQRCPYIHEMKERLLGAPVDGADPRTADPRDGSYPRDVSDPRDGSYPREPPRDLDTQVGTIVKVSITIIFICTFLETCFTS